MTSIRLHAQRIAVATMIAGVLILAIAPTAYAHWDSESWGTECPVSGWSEHDSGEDYHYARTKFAGGSWMLTACRVGARASYETWENGYQQVISCWAEGSYEAVTGACGSSYSNDRWSSHWFDCYDGAKCHFSSGWTLAGYTH